jgi:hypothetical protein
MAQTSFRLGQRPGSYVVLKYVRPLVKRRDTETLSCAPAPQSVIDMHSVMVSRARRAQTDSADYWYVENGLYAVSCGCQLGGSMPAGV